MLPEDLNSLSFATLRIANLTRLPEFKNRAGHKIHFELADMTVAELLDEPETCDWKLQDWLAATMGELGEAANLAKKWQRGDFTDAEQFKKEFGKELADVVTYLDFVAWRAGIDLGAATAEKWNEVAERVGFEGRIEQYEIKDPGGWENSKELLQLLVYIGENTPELSEKGEKTLFAILKERITGLVGLREYVVNNKVSQKMEEITAKTKELNDTNERLIKHCERLEAEVNKHRHWRNDKDAMNALIEKLKCERNILASRLEAAKQKLIQIKELSGDF